MGKMHLNNYSGKLFGAQFYIVIDPVLGLFSHVSKFVGIFRFIKRGLYGAQCMSLAPSHLYLM